MYVSSANDRTRLPARRATPAPALLSMLGLLLAALNPAASAEPPDTPSAHEIAPLIRQLGDRSFQVRASASRRLCMIGPAARPLLEQAARSTDFEVALRAKALLDVFDQLLFTGCEIEIAVSRNRIAWNEPLDLSLTVRNRSAYAATVPFGVSKTPGCPASREVGQVAALLDLADLLKVVGPDGAPIAFHADAADADPKIEAVLRSRAAAPPAARLEPHQTLRLQASNINRGGARYPTLREGTYRIMLAYEPQWDDEEFTSAGVGALRSNTVEVVVTGGAPAGVVGPGASPRLALTQHRGFVVARITNRQDVPLWVNGNFGFDGPPYAALRWLVYDGDDWRDWTTPSDGASRQGFAREKLIEIAPGGEQELGRADLATLRKTAAIDEGKPLFVRVVYSNLCDQSWQRHKKDLPTPLRAPLPARLLVTTLACEPLRID